MNKSRPLVSIIVPVYNSYLGGGLIEKCIRSILENTYINFELIIVDDGSNDHTVDLAKEVINGDSRCRIIECEHRGVAATRNTGIDLAKGEWIMFADSDDYILPLKLDIMIDAALNSSCQIVKCGILHKDLDGAIKSIMIFPTGILEKDALLHNAFDRSFVTNAIYKTSLLNDNHIRFPECDMAEDFLFNILAITYAGKLYNLSDPLTYYCRRVGSLSFNFKYKPDLKDQKTIDRVKKTMKCKDDVIERLKDNENFKYLNPWIEKDMNYLNKYLA